MFFYKVNGGFVNQRRCPAGDKGVVFFSSSLKPVDEFFSGENGGGCHGVVGLRLGALIKDDFLSVLHEGAFENLDVGEFVGKSTRAIGSEFAEIFDGAGVPPCEQAVEVADLGEEGVVAIGADDDDGLGGL